MQIPPAYGTLGRMIPTVSPIPAPGINDGTAPAQALGNLANSLSNFGAAEADRQFKVGYAAADTKFKGEMVTANQKLDEATKEIIKRAPASEQKDLVKQAAENIQGGLFDNAPAFAQHYLPSFQQQVVQSGMELEKAQDAAKKSDALIKNMDYTVGFTLGAESILKKYDPRVPGSDVQALNDYRTVTDQTINTLKEKHTAEFGPAIANQLIEPLISTAKTQYIALHKGMVKSAQDSVKADLDSGVAAISNSALPVGEKLKQIQTVLSAGWVGTGEGQDALTKRWEKEFQTVTKDQIDKDLTGNLHSVSGLKAFISAYGAKGEDGKEFTALPGMDLTVRQSYLKQAAEKLKAEQDRLAKENKEKASQAFTLAKDMIKDATDRSEMPSASLIATLNQNAVTPMQREYVNHVTTKVNSTEFQVGAMAKDPYRYTVSTLSIPENQKKALLQPLSAQNIEKLLPARIAMSVQYNIPPITADEAVALVKMSKDRNPMTAVNTVNNITSKLPASLRGITTSFIASEIGKRDQVLGNALALNVIDPGLSGMYINGAQLLRDKSTDLTVAKQVTKSVTDINERLQGTGITNYTTDYDRIVDVYKTTLAGIQAKTGSAPSSDVADNIFKKLVGDVVETSTGSWAGSYTKTIVPSGVDSTRVINFSRNDQPELAKTLGVDVKTLRAPLTWTPGGYKLLKDGQYIKGANRVDVVIPFDYFTGVK